ncbi:MAG TPA: TldD/PmbA family protein [Candidatus Nanoarchaeia archaeon]|nr:TldD/PmbA family protein [Candidatus Nanoarchaeia archaeon]
MKEIIDYAVKKFVRSGADDVVATMASNRTNQIKFVNSKIISSNEWDSVDASFFVTFNKKVIMTSLKNLTKKSADETVKKVVSFSKNAVPNKEYNGIAEGPFKYKKIEDVYDKKIMMLEEKTADIVNDSTNVAMKNGAKRCSGVLETQYDRTYLVTTNEVRAEDEGTRIYFSIRSFTDKNASGHKVAVSRMLKYFNPEKTADESAEIAVMAKNPEHIVAGKYDMIFAPLPFANIIEHLGSGASIFSVESGLSCLNGKLGKKIAPEKFALTDDGTLRNGIYSAKFDAEGVPTQKNPLIEKGVLKTYLHNTSTAKKYGVKTTANAGLISPAPHNLVVGKGGLKKEELIAGMKKGIYVTNIWYTRFQNYSTGDFSTLPRDGCFLVENGRIIKSIRNIRINENLLNMMANISQIGSDLTAIKGWEVETPVVLPHIIVRNVSITKPEEVKDAD